MHGTEIEEKEEEVEESEFVPVELYKVATNSSELFFLIVFFHPDARSCGQFHVEIAQQNHAAFFRKTRV